MATKQITVYNSDGREKTVQIPEENLAQEPTSKMEEIARLWKLYDEYKERAEQHEFVTLFMYDSWLVPLYEDLLENYTEKHADIFIRGMKIVLGSLGASA